MDRFWSKVDKSGDCWLWTAGKDKDGYGRIQIDGKWCGAHRISWKMKYGEIPDGMSVLHECDVPSCVNQNHLWLGTTADNVADMIKKGRGPDVRGEHHGGSKLLDTDILIIRHRYELGNVTQKSLGRVFGVTEATIGGIVRREHWKHI